MAAVHSFDVFDTVIMRRVGDPDAVIDVLAERLHGEGMVPVAAAVFAAARKHHERRLVQLAGRHLPLRAIHAEVARALSIDPAVAESWARAEEQLERELTVAVPGAREMIEESRAAGHQVVFVSDTPHSESFVRELLVSRGVAGDGDLVFTSSDRGSTKSRGGLFEAIAGVVGSDRDYLHRGDNRRSDLGSARLEGWRSRLVPQAQLTRYEKLLEARSHDTALATSWLAGASRLARLEARHRGVAGPVADVAAGSMAPFLVGYVLWLFGQARTRGLRRLYFVARDGEIMLEVARRLAPSLAPELELRYLYGSRQPWVLGACATSDAILAHWATGRTDFTARTTLGRMGLTPERAHELVGREVTRPDRADVPLAAAAREELARLMQQEPLLPLIRAAARQSADRTTAYLRQEGLLDGTPSALVDAGWNGRAAAALDQLLVAAGGKPVPHFFVGLLGQPVDDELRRDVELVPWLFNRQAHPGVLAGLHGPNVLVEMFCAATTGRTVDYAVDETDGQMGPVLDREDNEPALAWGLAEIQRIALRVAELVGPQLSPDAVHADSAAYAWDVLSAFWAHPTRAEVAAWGTFPGEEEIWPPFMPLAQRITAGGMARRVLRGEATMRPNNTWRAGSALASRHPWRALLTLRAWREENGARVRRIPRRLRLEIAYRRRR